jgi:NTP pyrophosphatase (non-canonical NTP hydrolase)
MNIDQLDRKLIQWGDKFYISPYTIREDSELMILILQEATKEVIEAHLRSEHAAHFAEIEEEA